MYLVLPTTLKGRYDCASSQIRSHETEKLIPLFKGLQLENGRAGIFTEFFCIPQHFLMWLVVVNGALFAISVAVN